MKLGRCKISKSARSGLEDTNFAASLMASPSRQRGPGLEPEELVGCGPPGNWQGCPYSKAPTLPKTFEEAAQMQAVRPPPGLTDIDPIKPNATVSTGIAQGGPSRAGAPFDQETYAAGLAAATQANVRIKLRTPPPVSPPPVSRAPAAPASPQPRRAAPLSAPVSPQPHRPQASSVDPMHPGLGIFSFADCMFGKEQRPQIPVPTSQPPVRPELKEPCKVLRVSSAEPVKVAQVPTLWNDNMPPNSANDFATTCSTNDFLWPKQGGGSSRTCPTAAAAGRPSSASSMTTVQLYSPQVVESQRVLTGAIEGLQHSLQVMQQSFVDLQQMLGQPPPDCALPAAGAVQEPGGGAAAAAQATGVAPPGPPPGSALRSPGAPMALRALLWCSRSTKDWGDDSPQKSELLSSLCPEACGLRINNFPSATQFSRWLFVQERGPDVVPSSILIVGWREAKPCVKAIDAAVTGKDDCLRDDARRVLRKANGGPGDVRVLVGQVIILAEHDSTVERAIEFLDCRYAELDEEDVPLVVPVKVARTPSELRALIDDAAQGKAGHADATAEDAKPADKDCAGAEAAGKVSAQKLPLSAALKAFPAPLEAASFRL